MKKGALKWLFLGNLLAIVVVALILIFENSNTATGLAALSSVGRFVACLAILSVLIVCLLAQIFIFVSFWIKKK